MALSDVPAYVNRIGVHRDYNAQFFRMSDEAYADWLVNEAVRAGKVCVDGAMLRAVS